MKPSRYDLAIDEPHTIDVDLAGAVTVIMANGALVRVSISDAGVSIDAPPSVDVQIDEGALTVRLRSRPPGGIGQA